MAEDTPGKPEDEFRDMLRELLSGNSDIDPAKLASAAGLPNDPAMIAQLMSQLTAAMQQSGDGINLSPATAQARTIATAGTIDTAPSDTEAIEQALGLAALWLSEAT